MEPGRHCHVAQQKRQVLGIWVAGEAEASVAPKTIA